MIKSLADNEFLEYKDLEKVEGITDSYYLKREVACKDCAPTGTIISWTPTTMVKGYEAIYTTSYYNIVNLAEGKTDYNIDSYTEETGKKCIINLSQISEKEGGYLVFYGMASAGSYINYCEMLEEMDTFEIVIEKVTEPN